MKIQDLIETLLLEGVCPGEHNYIPAPLEGINLGGWKVMLDPHFQCNLARRLPNLSLSQIKKLLTQAYQQDSMAFDNMPEVPSTVAGNEASLKVVVPRRHLTIVIHKVRDDQNKFYNLRTVWTGAPKEYNRQVVLSTSEPAMDKKFEFMDWPVVIPPDILIKMENPTFHMRLIQQSLKEAQDKLMKNLAQGAEEYKTVKKLPDSIMSIVASRLPLPTDYIYIYSKKQSYTIVLYRDLQSKTWEMRELVSYDYKKAGRVQVTESYKLFI